MYKYIMKNGKRLRYGYTTGSCATGATKAALKMLFTKEIVEQVRIVTPKTWEIDLEIVDIKISKQYVSCAVVKDGGDDPDNTHGMYIYSKVSLNDSRHIEIIGGKGIGTVTKKGLPVEAGLPAINPVPRQMIEASVKEMAKKFNYEGGILIEISAPEGERVAKKTFNPKLGILGGISILGTTGIVEPMSERALVASLELELNILNENGHKNIILFPGNYGRKFTVEDLQLDISHSVKISNYIGDVINYINNLDFKNILIVAHIGKLIKVAAGIMNTHSKKADARMEVLAAYASACGGDSQLSRDILNCVTTDQAVELIKTQEFYEDILDKILERVAYHLNNRLDNEKNLGIILFTNTHGVLKICPRAKEMLHLFAKKEFKG